jgi:plastocyanin
MRRAIPTIAIAGCLLLLAAGCGSSSSSSGSTTVTSTTSSTPSSVSGGLKADSAPKYASPSTSEPVQSGTVQIAFRNIAIDPDTVRAKVGSTIKWTNEDAEKCNVTSEGGPYTFKSPDFGEGATFELKLDKPGTIHYECTYYPATMNGTIEVVE